MRKLLAQNFRKVETVYPPKEPLASQQEGWGGITHTQRQKEEIEGTEFQYYFYQKNPQRPNGGHQEKRRQNFRVKDRD